MKEFVEKLIKELEKVPTEYRHEEYNAAIYDVIKFTKIYAEKYNNAWEPIPEPYQKGE